MESRIGQFIEAMKIFKKYMDKDGDGRSPIQCEDGRMQIFLADPHKVTKKDRNRLSELGFDWYHFEENDDHFHSHCFGNADAELVPHALRDWPTCN